MAKNDKVGIDIGAQLASGIYSNAKLITNEVQPYFVLHKDTIRAFLHEKMSYLSSQGKLIGLLGVEVSLCASLLTATFSDWHEIKGSTIEAVFILSAAITGVLLLKEIVTWFRSLTSCSVDALTTELGKRGAVIETSQGVTDKSV